MQIVLGGFGSGFVSQFSWRQILQEDILQIQILTVDGFATYNIVVALPSPPLNAVACQCA